MILSVFAIYMGFQFISNKDRVANQNQSRQITSFTVFENGVIPPQAQEAIRSEVNSQTVLVRGEVSQFNRNTNIATVAIETRQLNGTNAVIGLLDISMDPKLIKEFSCWPSAFQSPIGEEISIRNAYMPVNSNAILYIKGEVKRPIDQLSRYLDNKPFIFALLNSSPTDAKAVLTDTSGLTTQIAKEVAVLGCNQ